MGEPSLERPLRLVLLRWGPRTRGWVTALWAVVAIVGLAALWHFG